MHIRTATDSDIPQIRVLVNQAYKELADMGLNYTATYQDEQTTRERISKGQAFVIEMDQKIIATVLLTHENLITGRNTGYVSQLAVHPDYKKQGLGTLLMNHCENLALKNNYDGLQLDTAQPAKHLVSWYEKLGFKIVGEIHYEGKTYNSYVFEKTNKTKSPLSP